MVEDNKTKSFVATFKNKKNLPVILGIVFLVLIVAVFLAVYLTASKNDNEDKGAVLFTLNDKEYYENEVKQIVRYPVEKGGLTEASAIDNYLESQKTIILAGDLGLEFPENVIDSKISELVPQSVKELPDYESNYKEWFRVTVMRDYAQQMINEGSNDQIKGNAFVFHFGQRIEYGDDYTPEGFNDPELIAQDKDYARQRAEYYFNQYESGSMNAEQIHKEIKEDEKLKTFVSTVNPFGYNPSVSWKDDVYYSSIIDYIQSSSTIGLSGVSIGLGYAEPVPKPDSKPVELYYYFVDIESGNDITLVSKDEFSKKLNEIKVERYYESDVEQESI